MYRKLSDQYEAVMSGRWPIPVTVSKLENGTYEASYKSYKIEHEDPAEANRRVMDLVRDAVMKGEIVP